MTACKVALENSIALLPIKLRESKSTLDLKENKDRITYQQEKPVSHTLPMDLAEIFRQADLGNSSSCLSQRGFDDLLNSLRDHRFDYIKK